MENDYLIRKKPLPALLLFSLPMVLGNLFQQLYTLADSAIVGRYVGEQALAAVGASYALTNIFICVAIGGGIGASVAVSRYFGAKSGVSGCQHPAGRTGAWTEPLDHGGLENTGRCSGNVCGISEHLLPGAAFFVSVQRILIHV